MLNGEEEEVEMKPGEHGKDFGMSFPDGGSWWTPFFSMDDMEMELQNLDK